MKKNIFLTGGTGSFGKKFIEMSLKNPTISKIVVFSRDEMKQWEISNFFNSTKLHFILGDVRDPNSVMKAMLNCNYVVHAAATKIVSSAETNPEECVKTNIQGAINVINAAIDHKIKKVVALSTDKASSPFNLYGATKLVSDKLFIAADSHNSNTCFSVVRYGNVLLSRGSLIPFYLGIKNGIYPVTHKDMTRFIMTLSEGVNLVKLALDQSLGGEIFVKKSASIKIVDVPQAINNKAKLKYIGIKPGEKLSEQLISKHDSFFTYDFKDYYKIISPLTPHALRIKQQKKGKKVPNNFEYDSSTNPFFLNVDDIKKLIKENFN